MISSAKSSPCMLACKFWPVLEVYSPITYIKFPSYIICTVVANDHTTFSVKHLIDNTSGMKLHAITYSGKINVKVEGFDTALAEEATKSKGDHITY